MRAVIIISAIILSSCELVVKYDIPFEKPDIVANSLITPDSLIRIKLTESKFILDQIEYSEDPFKVIENATVSIFENENKIGEAILKNKFYVLENFFPSHNQSYKIEIERPNYDKVIAQTKIPSDVPVFEISNFTSIQGEYQEEYSFELLINDPSELNYYEFSLLYEEIQYDYSFEPPMPLDTFYYPLPLSTSNPIFSELFDDYSTNNPLFNDVLFNGNKYSIKFDIQYLPFRYDNSTSQPYIKLYFTLKNVNREYYNYKVSTDLQNQTDGNFFTEPVPVYSNIENGLGIFGGYTSSQKSMLITQ